MNKQIGIDIKMIFFMTEVVWMNDKSGWQRYLLKSFIEMFSAQASSSKWLVLRYEECVKITIAAGRIIIVFYRMSFTGK